MFIGLVGLIGFIGLMGFIGFRVYRVHRVLGLGCTEFRVSGVYRDFRGF